jgi:hypothetical protein
MTRVPGATMPAIPLSIRNNNPGNVRPMSPAPQGAIGVNGGFIVFDTMENGIRWLAKQLMIYQDNHGIDTVAAAIDRWAPGSDHNDTAAYVAFVCSVLGCKPDDRFDFHDPDFLFWMVTAIGEEESGHDAFTHSVSDAQIEAGIQEALAA